MDYDRLGSQIYRQVPSIHPAGSPWWYVTAIWDDKPFIRGIFSSEEEANAWGRANMPDGVDWQAEPFPSRDMSRARAEFRARLQDRTGNIGLSLHRQRHVP